MATEHEETEAILNDPEAMDSIAEAQAEDKPAVTLLGQDGNAMMVLAACSRAARRAGWSKDKIDGFMHEAMDGDYDHLLSTVMARFEVD